MLCWFSARDEAELWLTRYGDDGAIEHLSGQIRSEMRARDGWTARRLDRILERVDEAVDRKQWERA